MRASQFVRATSLAIVFFASSFSSAQAAPAQSAVVPLDCAANGATSYRVSLRDRAAHILRVEIAFDGVKTREFQLPVWNALYQVRDFAQYVRKIEARGEEGKLDLQQLDKTTWRVDASAGCSLLSYEIYANDAGPFGTQLNEEHAFLNWAQVLMYPTDAKKRGFVVRIADAPAEWKLRDGGLFNGEAAAVNTAVAHAETYDKLIDSPVEIGKFAEADFEEGGAKYRVVVHADPSDYDIKAMAGTLQKIVTTTVDWMQDRPYNEYTFIYHLPRGPAGGGMEHANSTAIDITAQRLGDSPTALSGVSAHEFFHLWNVKRIRPQSLEPIDYTKENYTRALWFSEGVTSTVSEHMLFRAGLIDEKLFLERLAVEVGELNARPARRTQSVEESSLDAWLEKYAYYRQPERSISYYNKGQIAGELLDLRMRAVSGGKQSLRELFQWLNKNYARKGVFYPDSEGIQLGAESLTGQSFDEFFERFVVGTDDIPYEEFFQVVGLRPVARTIEIASLGFSTSRNFNQAPTVTSVEPGTDAQQNGIQQGEALVSMNGKPITAEVLRSVESMRPGDTVKVKTRLRGTERETKLRLASRKRTEYAFEESANVTPEQKAQRAAWLRLESSAGGARR